MRQAIVKTPLLALENGQCQCHKIYQAFPITFHWYQVNGIFSFFSYSKRSVRLSYFLFSIAGVNHFPILGKTFPQFYLIIIRECLQNNITHVLKYFINLHDFIYLDPYHLIHIPTPRVLSFALLKLHNFFIITFSINISVFFYYTIKCILQSMLKFLKENFNHMRW